MESPNIFRMLKFDLNELKKKICISFGFSYVDDDRTDNNNND